MDERIKGFDFSDHMRARRKLREDISSQVQSFLKEPLAPPESRFKFTLILVVCITAAIGSGFLAYESFESFIANTNPSQSLVTQPLNDVSEQKTAQRYGMDINRASWVIETAMEMTTKEGATLPEKWVEGAVHGLFQSTGNADTEVSSLAALGSIMGLAPEVCVGPDGTRVNFSPKSTKKAAKDTG